MEQKYIKFTIVQIKIVDVEAYFLFLKGSLKLSSSNSLQLTPTSINLVILERALQSSPGLFLIIKVNLLRFDD
jgi:hypothetical protein